MGPLVTYLHGRFILAQTFRDHLAQQVVIAELERRAGSPGRRLCGRRCPNHEINELLDVVRPFDENR